MLYKNELLYITLDYITSWYVQYSVKKESATMIAVILIDKLATFVDLKVLFSVLYDILQSMFPLII